MQSRPARRRARKRPPRTLAIARLGRWPRPFGLLVATTLLALSAVVWRPLLVGGAVLWALAAAGIALDARLRGRRGLAGLLALVGGPLIAAAIALGVRDHVRKVGPRFRNGAAFALLCGVAGGAVAFYAGRLLLERVAFGTQVASSAMSPKLGLGDRLLVSRLDVGHVSTGDIVAVGPFRGGNVLGRHGRVIAVLRVVGMPGDWIGAGTDQRLYICVKAPDVVDGVTANDGCVFPDESGYTSQPTPPFGPVDVPAGHVFLLGDHRSSLDDSRTIGPVPRSAIVGTVVATIWPLSRLGVR